ncbi:MAG: hypothetical protein GF350_11140 [Chitinivibrionales bacterium]|nr:hypothetical protein [Chitinivibrionales bacterium]
MKKTTRIAILFFISGCSGLIYQIVWGRMFGLVFGNTVYAYSTVLAAFMGGLGIGSLLAGRQFTTPGKGLELYGTMQLLIGVCALLVLPGINLADAFYVRLFRWFNPPLPAVTIIRLIFSFTMMLIPCTLMGATLPVISSYITRDIPDSGGWTGKLYGINTLGAVIGCFFSGYFFIGAFGITQTVIMAAALNILAGTAARVLSRQKQPDAAVPPGRTPSPLTENKKETPVRDIPLLLPLLYGISGFAALGLELAWTSTLVWVIGPSSYAFAAMISVVLAGIGCGSWLFSLFVKNITNKRAALIFVECAIGASVLGSLFILPLAQRVNNFAVFFAGPLNNNFGVGLKQVTVSAILFGLPSLLFGVAFPLFSAIYSDQRHSTARGVGFIYGANTIGAIAGSLAAGFFIMPAIGLFPLIALDAALFFIVAIILIITKERISSRVKTTASSVIIAGGAFLIVLAPTDAQEFLERTLRTDASRADEKLLYFNEHPTGNVLVKESAAYGREMIVDGLQVASSGSHDLHSHIYPSHLMCLLKEGPLDALIIAFGAGGTCGSMLLYDEVKSLDAIEICKGVVEAAKKFFSSMNNNVFSDPRFSLIIQDGLNYIRMTQKKYDIIYSGPIHPQANKSSAGLYTKEFFAKCKSRLRQNGIQCLWLPLHVRSTEDFKILVKTFNRVYPYTTLWLLPHSFTSSAHAHLIGSQQPIAFNYQSIARKLARPVVEKDISRLQHTPFHTPAEFLAQCALLRGGLEDLVDDIDVLNTENRPVIEFFKFRQNSKDFTHMELLKLFARQLQSPFPLIDNIPDTSANAIADSINSIHKGFSNMLMGHRSTLAYMLTPPEQKERKEQMRQQAGFYYSRAAQYLPQLPYLKIVFGLPQVKRQSGRK